MRGEGYLCEKFTIDGYDYYVSDEVINTGDWVLSKNSISPIFLDGGDLYPQMLDLKQWFKIVATNNPNIDIPKVLPINHCECNLTLYPDQKEICKDICDNKYQETYIFTEQDIINFAEWAALNMSITPRKRTWYRFADKTDELAAYTTKEILQIWKEQQSKIVYYE